MKARVLVLIGIILGLVISTASAQEQPMGAGFAAKDAPSPYLLGVQPQDQTLVAGFATKAPVLDGKLDAGEWKEAARINFDGSDAIRPGVTGPDSNTIGGPNKDGFQSAEDSSVIVYVMNDANNLYIAVDATDDVLDFSMTDVWRNDSVEIRVDGNFSRRTAKEGTIWGHSIIIRGDGGAVGSAPAGDLASGAAVKPDGTGWIVEFRQSIAGFAPVIGFDLAINDRDTPGQDNRDGQYRWNGEVDAGWDDETQWGMLVLATVPNPGPVQKLTAGAATTPPTLDGVLSLGEWVDAAVISFDGSDGVRPGVTGPDSNTIGGPNKDGFQLYEDSHVTAYIMNDANYLYIAVDATDDVLDFSMTDVWRNDSVEIRVDGNFSRRTAKEGTIWGHSIIIRGDGGAVGSAPAGDLASGAAVKPDGSGWIVEFRQSIAGFAPVIGFDLAINDRDTPGQDNRDGQYRWNGEVDAGWDNETQWGELTLAQVTAGLDSSKWELY